MSPPSCGQPRSTDRTATPSPMTRASKSHGYRLKQSAGRRHAETRAEQNQATSEIIDPDTGEITPG